MIGNMLNDLAKAIRRWTEKKLAMQRKTQLPAAQGQQCEYSGLILTNLVRDEFVVVVIVAVLRHWQWRCTQFGALTLLVRLPSTYDLNLWLESVIVVPTRNMCNFVISWFCDIVVDTSWWSGFMWFRDFVTQLWNCDDRNICMFSWFVNLWCHGGYYHDI